MATRRVRALNALICVLVLAVVACTAFSATDLFRRGTSARREPSPLLSLEGKLDFGEAWSQKSFPWTLLVRNVSNQAVRVTDIRTSCNCTSVEPKSFAIPSAGTAAIHLSLDLTSAPHKLTHSEFATPFSVTLLPVISEAETQTTWQLRGTVRRALIADPEVLELRFAADSAPGVQHVAEARLRTCAPASDIRVSGGTFPGIIELQQRSETEFLALLSACADSLPAGEHVFDIPLTVAFADGREVASGMRLMTTRVSDAHATPAELAFGDVPVGHTANMDLQIATYTGLPVALKEIDLQPSSRLSVTSIPQTASNKLAFVVTCTPSDPGIVREAIRFRVSIETESAVTEMTVPAAFYGVTPESKR